MKKTKRAQPRSFPLVLIAVGLVILGGLLVYALRQSRTTASALTPIPGEEFSFPDIERISLNDAKAALDNGQAVFVDVRDPNSYNAAHIPGAINIPLDQIEEYAQDLDPQQWIITYCT